MSNISEEYENFIKNISRIVQLRDDQFEDLMTTGTYFYNDPETRECHTVVKDPNTLYVAPSYNFKWLAQKVYNAMVQPFEPTPGAVTLNDMRDTVNRTLEEIVDFDSYIGMRGILQNGDYIKHSENYDFYVNGIKYETDYICQNRTEFVFLLFLAKDRAMHLKYDEVHFLPNELYVVRNGYQVSVENRICSAATYVTSNVEESCLPDLKACKYLELIANETGSSNISPNIEELYFHGRVINNNRFNGCTYLRKVTAPLLTTVGYNIFNGASNLELELPRLISSSSSNETISSGIKSIRFPKCFTNCPSAYLLGDINTVFFDCINVNITTATISGNKNGNVKHIYLAPGWNAFIPLHTFSNLDMDDMINNFNNLKNRTGEAKKEITLYSSFYDSLADVLVIYDDELNKYRRLTEEEAADSNITDAAISAIAIATNKNWTVTRK